MRQRLYRGTIYVHRIVNGIEVALPIDNQLHYNEWTGCFSAWYPLT